MLVFSINALGGEKAKSVGLEMTANRLGFPGAPSEESPRQGCSHHRHTKTFGRPFVDPPALPPAPIQGYRCDAQKGRALVVQGNMAQRMMKINRWGVNLLPNGCSPKCPLSDRERSVVLKLAPCSSITFSTTN